MIAIKLHDLLCFDAVVREGSFQAAARSLNKTHPSVFAGVARLERSTGLALLDRGGYRVALTEAGRSFHDRSKLALREVDHLQAYAAQLASGTETVLRVVIGDLCPRGPILRLLSTFFARHGATRLHLDYEAVEGPIERLVGDEADLVFHRADPADPRIERIDLGLARMVPVVAPGFLPFPISAELTSEQLRPFTQCVIRDTGRQPSTETFFLVDGAHRCSVPDQAMKRELILHRLAWGHLPDWLVAEDLHGGTLLSLLGTHLPGRTEPIAALRRLGKPHGPVAEALWTALKGDNPFEGMDGITG